MISREKPCFKFCSVIGGALIVFIALTLWAKAASSKLDRPLDCSFWVGALQVGRIRKQRAA